jgi:arsenite-transporting ATPase
MLPAKNFIAKGDVEKSTTSALTALFFAYSGWKTLLVSMDPAHNQQDLFEADFSEEPKKY